MCARCVGGVLRVGNVSALFDSAGPWAGTPRLLCGMSRRYSEWFGTKKSSWANFVDFGKLIKLKWTRDIGPERKCAP